MEKVHPWCGQPLDPEWLKNGTDLHFICIQPFVALYS